MERQECESLGLEISKVLEGHSMQACTVALAACLRICLQDRADYAQIVAQVVTIIAPDCVVQVFEHMEVANDG